ncbi:MAG TPA: DUF6228 family protein [Actinopolymorphaceae bacterium]|jgi:hypothetical protein
MREPLVLQYATPNAWILHPPTDPWGDGYVAVMRAELRGHGLHASTDVKVSLPSEDEDPDLLPFFQGLARDWRGWSGERAWRSLDGKLWIHAVHDGAGHVSMTATLRESASAPDAWTARVTVSVEAGEQMSTLVADLRSLFAR